jgi:folate-binding protein YgfZ
MSDAFLVDRSARMRMTFRGDKAKEALGGLLTNDVVALTRGAGMRAAALTPKGRVIALCRVWDRGDHLLVDADAAAGDGFSGMIRKFVNPRLARYALVTDATGCCGVYGEGAATSLAAALGIEAASLAALAPLAGLPVGEGEDAVFVVRSTDLGAPGFDVIGARERTGAIGNALAASGVRSAGKDEAQVLRIEAGLPEWGIEMDAETLAQEAALDELDAISFSKGCYTGQEVVARIHFRGHVNKLLRRLAADAPVAADARVLDAAGREVGEVRSSVVSPTRGPLAIAMVRREVAVGSEVQLRDADRLVRARVEPLTTGSPSTA